MTLMCGLREFQADFMRQLLDDDTPRPEHWSARQAAGLEVYRNNYRSSLVDALRAAYPRTERWVGGEPFRRAAAHHLITNPPAGWTIDEAGRGFDRTCQALFRNNPEVAELAWLELAIQSAFTSLDAAPLAPAAFAQKTAAFDARAWTELRLTFMPGVATRAVHHDLAAIWRATATDAGEHSAGATEGERSVVVWRQGEKATFTQADADEGEAIAALLSGASYGDICLFLAGKHPTAADAHAAATRAGGLLGKWLQMGLLRAIA
jgi:hypothetical protein